jgi:hypothetical protein
MENFEVRCAMLLNIKMRFCSILTLAVSVFFSKFSKQFLCCRFFFWSVFGSRSLRIRSVWPRNKKQVLNPCATWKYVEPKKGDRYCYTQQHIYTRVTLKRGGGAGFSVYAPIVPSARNNCCLYNVYWVGIVEAFRVPTLTGYGSHIQQKFLDL